MIGSFAIFDSMNKNAEKNKIKLNDKIPISIDIHGKSTPN